MSVFWCRPPGRRRRRRGGAGAGAGGKGAICTFLLTLAVAHTALVATTTARRPRVCLHTLERVAYKADSDVQQHDIHPERIEAEDEDEHRRGEAALHYAGVDNGALW